MPESILELPASPPSLPESTASYCKALIEHFCDRDDLSTYDPYDIWNTSLGFRVKKLYNRQPYWGLLPAAVFAGFDDLANNKRRLFYIRNEYPIVRALAALCLLNLHRYDGHTRHLERARQHIGWLLENSCQGYSGFCWGLGVPNAMKEWVYSSSTPYSTMTPYALEALVGFSRASADTQYDSVVESVFRFFDRDIQVMYEDEEALATSYGPFRDRTVINAASYTMYSYAACLPYVPRQEKSRIEARIRKLYTFVSRNQRDDGSWFYSPQAGSFIDCFHSCIVLKNVIKTARIVALDHSMVVVTAGYAYLKDAFLDEHHLLFKRFSVKNKPGLVRFDLYDNAEVLNLALLLGDSGFAHSLLASIRRHFCRGVDVYSQINLMGGLRNKNTLRWAVMPFLHAISQMLPDRQAMELPKEKLG
jgi:hypothetical protein